MTTRLSVTCPVCGGGGHCSWLRNGRWLNEVCPGLNAVCDCDTAPFGFGLDNAHRKRITRIEFKNPSETISKGQRWHLEAFLGSVSRPWVAFAFVVVDAGQTDTQDRVRWWQRQTGQVKWIGPCDGTVQYLAETIVGYTWPQTLAIPAAPAREAA